MNTMENPLLYIRTVKDTRGLGIHETLSNLKLASQLT